MMSGGEISAVIIVCFIPVILVAACVISVRNRADAAADPQPAGGTSNAEKDGGVVIDGGQVAEAAVEIQGCCCGGGGGCGGDGGGCGGCGGD